MTKSGALLIATGILASEGKSPLFPPISTPTPYPPLSPSRDWNLTLFPMFTEDLVFRHPITCRLPWSLHAASGIPPPPALTHFFFLLGFLPTTTMTGWGGVKRALSHHTPKFCSVTWVVLFEKQSWKLRAFMVFLPSFGHNRRWEGICGLAHNLTTMFLWQIGY